MMTSQVVRGLEERGLLRRERHPTDLRAMRLTLTDAGQKLVAQALERVETADASFFAPLGPEEATLTRLLFGLGEAHRDAGDAG